MTTVSGLPDHGSTATELLALKEVHQARRLIDLALKEWWAAETFDRLHDAAEVLGRAAWRLGVDGTA
jgi:hypothetical protein